MKDKMQQYLGPRRLLFLAIFVFLLNCPLAYSLPSESDISYAIDPTLFEIENHDIKIDILSVNEINIAEKFTVLNVYNSSLDSIDMWINQSLSNLDVRDYNGSMSFSTIEFSESSHLLNIQFRSGLLNESSATFVIWYVLDRVPIAESGNSYYFFEFYTSSSYPIREQIIEVKIPERSFIHEEEGLTPYYPSDGFAIAGQRVFLSWTFSTIEPDEQTFIFVRFDKPIKETPVLGIVFGVIGGVVVGIGTTLLFMRRREKKVVQQISTIYLSDTQKLLLKLISESEGKILQKDLCIETGYTKSRISRNIVPLEEQGLVERDKWGKNYIIRLTENGRKVVE